VEKNEYMLTQSTIMELAREARKLDLEGFLGEIQRCHSTGPFQDPSLYKQAVGNLSMIERLARAVKTLKAHADEVLRDDLIKKARQAGIEEPETFAENLLSQVPERAPESFTLSSNQYMQLQASLSYIRRNTLYWDYETETLTAVASANSGTVVGAAAEVQLKVRRALEALGLDPGVRND